MRKFVAVSFALMLMASTASPSLAATSPEGATALKKQVEEALAFPLSLGKGYGEGLTLSGPVEVATKGDYYEVKLPGAKVGIAMGFKLDIGTVTINITPNDKDGSLETAIAIPTTIRALDDAGAVLSELNVGTQRFNGTWQPDLAAFTKLDSEYSNITLKGTPESKFTGTIGSIKAYANLAKNGDDSWSGPYGMSGENLKINIGSGITGEASIASFEADSSYEKINLKSRKAMQDNFNDTLAKAFANGQPTPEQAGQMMQKMMESMSGFLDGMASNVELNGISIVSKADPANPQSMPFNASIEKASMAFDVKGMLQPKGSTTVKLKLEGLKPDADPAIAGMIPNNANLEIYVENLPMQSLGSSLANALGGVLGMFGGMGLGAVDPAKQQEIQQQTQMQMMTLMTTVPQQLVSAGTQVSIRNTYTDSTEFDTNLDGSFKANAASPMMADGKLTLSLKGVDELILKLQGMSQGPNANQRLAGYATVLSMLQVYTKPEQGPDGKSVRKLVLEVSPEGSILLNGQPLQGMMGGMPPVPGLPQETPPQ